MYRIITEKELRDKLTAVDTEKGSNNNEENKVLEYFMPDIECPWTAKCSPYFDEQLRNESNDYLNKYSNITDDKVIEHLRSVCVGGWGAWVYSLAKDKQRLVNLVNLCHFICFIDDQQECNWGEAYDCIDKSNKFWINYTEMFFDDNVSSLPIYFREFKSIVNNICADLSEKQINLFKGTFSNWGLINRYTETTNKNLKVLDFESQVENRMLNTGLIWCFFLIEYEMNIDLTDFERNHRLMIEYVREAIKQISLVNDLYSFRKEYINANGDYSQITNIMATLINYHKLNANTAVFLIKHKIEECNHRCNQIKREILDTNGLNSLNVQKYLTAAEYLMSGNLEWSKTSPRYHGTHFVSNISNSIIKLTGF